MLLRLGGALGLGNRDRRRQPRIVRYFDCTWSSAWGEEHARISSLNAFGCYIESRFSVPAEGTEISDLTVSVSTETLLLQGTVIDATPGIGFAVRFTQLDPHICDCLKGLADVRHS
ncbi:MAG TPA: hypothetical protein VGF24_06660 [Vicinamibacterales bacterium]|jgi:hypothetical protein